MKPSLLRSERGFTLIETMIVIALIVAMFAFGFRKIDNTNNQIKSAVRKFTALSKQLHSYARLNNATYRIVFDLGVGGKNQKYWVEKANGPVIPKGAELTMEPLKDSMTADEKKEAEAKAAGGFEVDTKIFKEKKNLPDGVKIDEIEMAELEKPVTSGLIFVHYFPQGMANEAIIKLSAGEKLKWSLVVEPLTGRIDILTEHIGLKDLRE